ncbi:hypothetical protein D3C86_2215220 [compost metagenome]
MQDVRHGSHVAARATVVQQQTHRPVQFEITEQARESLESTVRYLGIEVDDTLEMAEQTEV